MTELGNFAYGRCALAVLGLLLGTWALAEEQSASSDAEAQAEEQQADDDACAFPSTWKPGR